MINNKFIITFSLLIYLFAYANAQANEQSIRYQVFDDRVLQILDTTAELEILADGFDWAEGPLWINAGNFLLFSDIPNNTVYRYDDENGISTYLTPSHFANGLALDPAGRLLLMQSRSRKVGLMATKLSNPQPEYEVLVSHFQGKRLNSPNDVAVHANGSIFFTDPPYGLEKQLQDPAKELNFQGVYKITSQGQITLVDKSLLYPNGIALAPDQKTLYVAVSDSKSPTWYKYLLDEQGNIDHKQLFYQPELKEWQGKGSADGLKVHSTGIVFATGSGGLWIFSEQGELLAKVGMPGFTSNLVFNTDESFLYFTADSEIRRLRLISSK